MKSINKSLLLLCIAFLIVQLPAYSTDIKTDVNQSVQYAFIAIATFSIIAGLLSIIRLYFIILGSFIRHQGIIPESREKKNIWSSLKKKMTDIVPVENERDILLHHEYDGIHELDNNLPPWWLYGFYFTIVFGIIYLGYYHFSETSMNSTEEYEYEVKQAKISVKQYLALQSNDIDEENIEALTDSESINFGELIFNTNCVTCHLEGGGGSSVSIGPNLTDEFWIHGGDVPSIFNTIKYGVPEKGMIAWKAQLSNSDIHRVTSYVVSLQGTNPPNAKAPEGDKYLPKQSAEKDESI